MAPSSCRGPKKGQKGPKISPFLKPINRMSKTRSRTVNPLDKVGCHIQLELHTKFQVPAWPLAPVGALKMTKKGQIWSFKIKTFNRMNKLNLGQSPLQTKSVNYIARTPHQLSGPYMAPWSRGQPKKGQKGPKWAT